MVGKIDDIDCIAYIEFDSWSRKGFNSGVPFGFIREDILHDTVVVDAVPFDGVKGLMGAGIQEKMAL